MVSKEVKKDIAIITSIIILMIIAFFLFSKINIEQIKQIVLLAGIFGPIVYIAMMALAIIISPIPSLPLDVAAGAIYGGLMGGIYTLIGAEIGAIIAFIISRKFGRKIFEKHLQKIDKFTENNNENKIIILIFLTRLVPLINFDVISYAAGLTKIRLWKFAIATLLGMAPFVFIFSYSGQALNYSWIFLPFFIILIFIIYIIPKYFIKNKKLKEWI